MCRLCVQSAKRFQDLSMKRYILITSIRSYFFCKMDNFYLNEIFRSLYWIIWDWLVLVMLQSIKLWVRSKISLLKSNDLLHFVWHFIIDISRKCENRVCFCVRFRNFYGLLPHFLLTELTVALVLILQCNCMQVSICSQKRSGYGTLASIRPKILSQ